MIKKENLDKTSAWPFVEAKKLLRERKSFIEKKGKITLQTGYGPSGLPHIGTFGEVARTSMMVNALKQLSDFPTEIITFSDDMDGLRKVPDNVPNQELLKEISWFEDNFSALSHKDFFAKRSTEYTKHLVVFDKKSVSVSKEEILYFIKYLSFNYLFKKGKVKYPLRNLKPGLHTIKLKCWDTYNNPSESTLSFIVVNDNDLILSNVLNYPNPFISYTEFWFNHNKPNETLDVQVQIFTVSGKLVKTLNRSVQSDGLLSREISWNGLDDFGNKIGKGVYVYKLHVRSQISNA